jgi:thioredoxin reductase (NADPH)
MSEYLIREIDAVPRITVRYSTEIVDGEGEHGLERLLLRDRTTGGQETMDADALFVLIGSYPGTDWLEGAVFRDEWGFLCTGDDLPSDRFAGRTPLPLETSMPGVFAVGDVRRGSVKRVASAVGEGAMAVRMVHEHLAKTR